MPKSSEKFKCAMKTEFVTFDHVQRKVDKVRSLVQYSSVGKYLTDFRNLVGTIEFMNGGKQVFNSVQV